MTPIGHALPAAKVCVVCGCCLLVPDTPNTPHQPPVIVTIGPATNDVETMCELLRAGMSCARFDLTVCMWEQAWKQHNHALHIP